MCSGWCDNWVTRQHTRCNNENKSSSSSSSSGKPGYQPFQASSFFTDVGCPFLPWSVQVSSARQRIHTLTWQCVCHSYWTSWPLGLALRTNFTSTAYSRTPIWFSCSFILSYNAHNAHNASSFMLFSQAQFWQPPPPHVGTPQMSVYLNLTPPTIPWRKSPTPTPPSTGHDGWTPEALWTLRTRGTSSSLPGIETGIVGCPFPTLITILTELYHIPK